MQCEICKSAAATIHLTEIIDGQRTEKHLCQGCATDEGITVQSQLSLNELLSSLLAAGQQQAAQQGLTPMDEAGCPNCGMTMEQFKRLSLLGCPQDYQVMGESLEAIIRRAQDGNTQHTGKVPPDVDLPKQREYETQVGKLQAGLEDALKREDYETAAELRDQIRKLQ